MSFFFFFNDTATTEIYTLSLHDALPISIQKELAKDSIKGVDQHADAIAKAVKSDDMKMLSPDVAAQAERSEEHTSELQSQSNLVCRLLLEKKTRRAPSAATSPSRITPIT